MRISINPGSGPVKGATEDNSVACIEAFAADLAEAGLTVVGYKRLPDADDGGRFGWRLRFDDGRTVEIDMPGLPVEQVRFVGAEDQDIWHFPRLYVDGASWVWKYALNVCRPYEEDE